ncbi:hypothetical protein GCM10010519_04950 [Streptomyces lactacystinicus]
MVIAAQHCTVVLVIEQPVRQRTLPRLGPSPWWGDTLILDLLDPEEARTPPIAMKDYSDEFRADTVALYESTLGATYKDIAADLGINRATLREWVLRDRERRGVVPTVPRSGG